MKITSSHELEVCSSRTKKPLRLENLKPAGSKNTAYGYDQDFPKKILKGSEPSASQERLLNCESSMACSFSVKGKEILLAKIGVQELNARLSVLEEENEAVKQAFIETMGERKELISEIYQHFQKFQHCHHLGDQVRRLKFPDGAVIASANSSNQAVMGSGLSQVLSEDSNPCVVSRDHRASMQFRSWFSRPDDSS